MPARKVDDNQFAIVDALRRVGANVLSLAAVGKGCPDLLIGYAGDIYLLEVKGEKGKLTPAQRLWHKVWENYVDVVRSEEEALRAIGALGEYGCGGDGE